MKRLRNLIVIRKEHLLIATGLVAMSASVVFGTATASQSRAEIHSDDKLNFDVASVKSWQPNQPLPKIAMGVRFSQGRVYAPCSDLWALLRYAFHLTIGAPITGLPNWAKAQCGPNTFSIDATMPNETTQDQSRQMMQSLLEDRFKMRVHWEEKEMHVFVLTIGPGGFKGKPFDLKTAKWAPQSCPEDDPACGQSYGSSTISDLANSLSFFAGRPIIDKTGLTDRYEVNFMFANDRAENSSLPSLSTVLREKFGLLMKPQTAPVDVLIVDSVEKPSPNLDRTWSKGLTLVIDSIESGHRRVSNWPRNCR
ncbi:MAG TPA: TIGR03435 family protein [Candidatus Acidoferrales bacterium]|nr:TIGR03435 family protein [Candidatus Acidoferrales bacterium]